MNVVRKERSKLIGRKLIGANFDRLSASAREAHSRNITQFHEPLCIMHSHGRSLYFASARLLNAGFNSNLGCPPRLCAAAWTISRRGDEVFLISVFSISQIAPKQRHRVFHRSVAVHKLTEGRDLNRASG